MPAYMFVRCRIHDGKAFGAYAKRAGELVSQFGGQYVVRGGVNEMLEGDLGEGAFVISKWPSVQAARTFWDSPEYQEAKFLREGVCDADVMLIEGCEDD